MFKAYIYPISNRLKSGIYNPYIDNFIHYSKSYTFINANNPSNTGIFNILKYITKIDVIFFNWIEKIPEFKGGLLQTIFLWILLAYCKLRKIKIVWTMHNNVSHSNNHASLKKCIFNMMIKKSDLIITHSKDGIDLIKAHIAIPKHIFYFPHPVVYNLVQESKAKKFDILIWGSIVPYKGIDLFLEFLHQKKLQRKYTIKIIGKCADGQYFKKLETFTNDYIKIENRFIDNKELQYTMSSARIVLFTYHSESILSSGALADSLSYGALVIGPNKAAFKDMADLKHILAYENFDTLINLIDKILSGEKIMPEKRSEQYLRELHWSEFAIKLQDQLNQLS